MTTVAPVLNRHNVLLLLLLLLLPGWRKSLLTCSGALRRVRCCTCTAGEAADAWGSWEHASWLPHTSELTHRHSLVKLETCLVKCKAAPPCGSTGVCFLAATFK
jgi:hypothetical protein